LGDLADGLIVINDWFPQIRRPGAAEINERFKARTGVDMLGNSNTTYAGRTFCIQHLKRQVQ
jgi:hypothetical protein